MVAKHFFDACVQYGRDVASTPFMTVFDDLLLFSCVAKLSWLATVDVQAVDGGYS